MIYVIFSIFILPNPTLTYKIVNINLVILLRIFYKGRLSGDFTNHYTLISNTKNIHLVYNCNIMA